MSKPAGRTAWRAALCLGIALTAQPAGVLAATGLPLPPAAVRLELPVADLAEASDALVLHIPHGRTEVFRTKTHHPSPGLTGVLGRSGGSDRLYLFLAGDRVVGGDLYATGGHYRLVEQGADLWWVPVLDLPAEFTAGGDDVAMLEGPSGTAVPAKAAPDAAGNYAVDLLILFTPLYAERYGGSAGAAIEAQRLVFLANGYFEHSRMPVRYRVAGVKVYAGSTETDDMRQNLAKLPLDAAVRELRERTQADLVILLRTMDHHQDLCGLAAGFNGLERGGDPPERLHPERDAFAVAGMGPNVAGNRCTDSVFAHELGHNLAGGHDLAAFPLPAYWRPYSRAWSCGIAGPRATYVSVMHAGHFNGVNPSYEGLSAPGDFFSSPALSLDGMPCGVPAEAGEGAADNARAITEAAAYVAAYRGAGKALPAGEGVVAGAFGIVQAFWLLLAFAAASLRH